MAEVGKVRHWGFGGLRGKHLPLLTDAASLVVGLGNQPHVAIERLVSHAIDRLGSGTSRDTAKALFGAASTRNLEVGRRSARAAEIFEKDEETFLRRWRRPLEKDVAEQIVGLMTDHALGGEKVGPSETDNKAKTSEEPPRLTVRVPKLSMPVSVENDYVVTFSGSFANWQLAAVRSSFYPDDHAPLEVCIQGEQTDRHAFEMRTLRRYHKDSTMFVKTICEDAVRYLGGYYQYVGEDDTAAPICDLLYRILDRPRRSADRQAVKFEAWLDVRTSFSFHLSEEELQALEERTGTPRLAMTRNLSPLSLYRFQDHLTTKIFPGLLERWLDGIGTAPKDAREFFDVGNWQAGLA